MIFQALYGIVQIVEYSLTTQDYKVTNNFTVISSKTHYTPPALHLLLCYVRHITVLFHTYNSFNGNFDGFIGYPIYWSSLLDESCNSLAQASQNEGLTARCRIKSVAVTK